MSPAALRSSRWRSKWLNAWHCHYDQPLTLEEAPLAQADTAFFQSIIEYNKSIAHVNYRKGALLELNNIYVTEGTWDPKAYEDALTRAWERTYSLKHPLEGQMRTEPSPKKESMTCHSRALRFGVNSSW